MFLRVRRTKTPSLPSSTISARRTKNLLSSSSEPLPSDQPSPGPLSSSVVWIFRPIFHLEDRSEDRSRPSTPLALLLSRTALLRLGLYRLALLCSNPPRPASPRPAASPPRPGPPAREMCGFRIRKACEAQLHCLFLCCEHDNIDRPTVLQRVSFLKKLKILGCHF